MSSESEGVDGEIRVDLASCLHVGRAAGGDHSVGAKKIHSGLLRLGLVSVRQHYSRSNKCNKKIDF